MEKFIKQVECEPKHKGVMLHLDGLALRLLFNFMKQAEV